MDSVLISSISKSLRRYTWVYLLFFISCSLTDKKRTDEESIRLDEELASLTNKVKTIEVGPILKSGGAFDDKTVLYGLESHQAVALNAVDFNSDGLTDIALLPTYYSRPKILIFDKEENKYSIWDHDPFPLDFKASYLFFYDLNKDNILDLVAGVLNQRSEVSQIPLKVFYGQMNQGKLTFIENPEALRLPVEPSSSVSIVDFDLDGWPDIFVSNWFESKNNQFIPHQDRLLKNNKGTFIDVSASLRGESEKKSDQLYPPNAKPTYGSSTCDIDQNGWPDILTVSSSGFKNKLWMNLEDQESGNRYFEDVGNISNYGSDPDGSLIPSGGGRSFFSACADYNNDGLMDVFLGELSHAYDNDSVDKSSILTGSKETYPPFFLRTEYLSDATSESWNQGDRRGVWFDYNLDGRIDLLVDNSGFPPLSRLVIFEQDESHAFINVAGQLGVDVVNPSASIILDVNRDGYPDILTAQNNIRNAEIKPRLYLFENKALETNRKIVKVHLNGVKSNTLGLGAMVMLYTELKGKKNIQRRWVEFSQGGLPSQNEEGIIFGVKDEVEVVGIKVRWPYIKKNGFSSGEVFEKLYSLKKFGKLKLTEVTVCEDGKILKGKTNCRL